SFIFGHYFLATLKYLAHQALFGNGKNLQAVTASLLKLLALHLRELRQVVFGPFVLDKLERIILPQWMALPVRRQEYAAQIRMIDKVDAEQIEYFTLQPVCRRPYAGHALKSFAGIHRRLQTHALICRDRRSEEHTS